MLEGEALFENTAETAYRLCTLPNTLSRPCHQKWNRVFSAHWDPTGLKRTLTDLSKLISIVKSLRSISFTVSLSLDENKLILCSQNGQLRILDRTSKESKSFCVLFRGFQVDIASDNTNGKCIWRSHPIISVPSNSFSHFTRLYIHSDSLHRQDIVLSLRQVLCYTVPSW